MNNMHTPKYFLFYLDNIEMLRTLSNEQLGQLWHHIFDFLETRTLQAADDPAVNMAYRFITAQIRRDFEKYDQKCRKNAENGRKGGRPKTSSTASDETEKSERFSEKPKKANTNTKTKTNTNTNTNTNTKSKREDKDEHPSGGMPGSPPTLAEAAAYAESIGGVTSPEIFHSFYESNGWMNKNGQPVCDWRAAYRYWNEQDKLKARHSPPAPEKKAVPESPMAEAYKSLVYNLVE